MAMTVVIIGRPNVGKSTLFNRLVGRRLAIVDGTPGVTRDRREGDGRISDLQFRLIDTAGLEDADSASLAGRMTAQTQRAAERADVAMMVIDARAGITALDEHFADWLRKLKTPVIVVANKCEGSAAEGGRLEAYALGLGEPIAVSAEHGQGIGELYDALVPHARHNAEKTQSEAEGLGDSGDEEDDAEVYERPLQLAIVGRPNVGKSTLINRLVGEDRMLTGPEAGITRDSISISWSYKDRDIRLVDTAGLRRKSRVQAKLETLSALDTLRTIRFAQVVVLMMDADQVVEKQDLTIARNVIEEGRGLVIAVNKWDAATDRDAVLGKLRDRLQTSLPQVRGIPVVTMSALTGRGVDKLLPAVLETFDLWNSRISTGALNRWLDAMLQAHPPPMGSHGRRLKIRYMTQAKSRPPTFVLFSATVDKLAESYLRYLINGLRDDFNLGGIPIRILTRKGKNPYSHKR